MSVNEAYGRVCNGICIIIIVRQIVDFFKVIIYRRRLVIASTTMETTIISVKSSLHRITSIWRIIASGSSYMPFPTHICTVSTGFHYFGNRGIFFVNLPPVSWTVFINLCHPSQSSLMLVSSCKQRGTAWTTASCILELAESDPFLGEFVYVGSSYFTAIATKIGESHVVTHYKNNIG